jgi:hypothetical protein
MQMVRQHYPRINMKWRPPAQFPHCFPQSIDMSCRHFAFPIIQINPEKTRPTRNLASPIIRHGSSMTKRNNVSQCFLESMGSASLTHPSSPRFSRKKERSAPQEQPKSASKIHHIT